VLHHIATNDVSQPEAFSIGVLVREDGPAGTVWVERTGAVDGGEAQAPADDERVPLRARVQRRERVAHGLNCRRCQRRALADVQARQPTVVRALHRTPATALAPQAAVHGQGVHGTVGDVLAVVESQGAQVGAPVRQGNHALI
jgi:hypothetical protein